MQTRLFSIPDRVFRGLSSLKRLYLQGNRLTMFPDHALEGLSSLEVLDFSDNRVSRLPAGIFDGLTVLRILRFQGNQLTALPKGLFIGLNGMRWVWAHDNPGAPFPLSVSLAPRNVSASEADRIARIAAETATGAPFDMTMELSVMGGVADLSTLQIPTGASSSREPAVITRSEEEPVWARLGPPLLPYPPVRVGLLLHGPRPVGRGSAAPVRHSADGGLANRGPGDRRGR